MLQSLNITLFKTKHPSWMLFVVAGILTAAFGILVLGDGRVATQLAQPQPSQELATQQFQPEEPVIEYVSNELLIKIKSPQHQRIKKDPEPEDTGLSSLNKLNKEQGVTKFERIAKPSKKTKNPSHEVFRWYKITLAGEREIIKEETDARELSSRNLRPTQDPTKSQKIKSVLAKYKIDTNIETAELNYIVHTTAVPNDPYYSSSGSWGQSYEDLWGLKKINAAGAWDTTTGSPSVVVAVIDSGVDRNHEDLEGNMWVNTFEIPNNGIDDDSNGYIDDYYGWDFYNNDNDPMDDYYHGTHVAGTIAAVGNNSKGVVGVNWGGRIMALKFLGSNGWGSTSDAVVALQYAADMGAKISSNSWGSFGPSAALEDAINYEHDQGMVVVAAAGNNNIDALDFFPAAYDRVITVAASDPNDAKASFSNWGEKIDVSAPGVGILSAKAAGTSAICDGSRADVPVVGIHYCVVYGTSMAAPHVSGLATLLLAKNPNLANEEIRQIVRIGANDLGVLGKDNSFGYGRINAASSMSLSDTKPLTPIITSPKSRTKVGGTGLQILGSVPGPNFSSYKIEAGAGRFPTTWTTITTSTSQVINGVLATVDTTELTEGFNIFRLTATDQSGKTYQFQVYDIEVDNFDAELVTPRGYMAKGGVAIMGSAAVKNGLTLQNYTIEWGEGTAPKSFSTNGITLTNGGTQPVTNGQLATWTTSQLTVGQTYTVRLIVRASNGASVQKVTTARLDQDMVIGWPKVIFQDNAYAFGVPTAIADLDGDGAKEVVIAAQDGKIYAFRKDGSLMSNFPFTASSGHSFQWGANIADIDNDGKQEILATAFNNTGYGGKLYIVKSDGTAYPGWPIPSIGGTYQEVDNTPLVVDLNNDGSKEIVVTEGGGHNWITIHAYQLNGTEINGFPKTTLIADAFYTPHGSLSATDMNRDGRVELAIGNANKYYLFDNQGNLLPGWPYTAASQIEFDSPAAFGDIDGDGKFELFAIGRDTASAVYQATLYGLRIDGTTIPNYPQTQAGIQEYNNFSRLSSPSIADVNNDGKDEVVVGLEKLAVFNQQGLSSFTTTVQAFNPPAISDVNGDGSVDFVSTWFYKLGIALNNGAPYWNRVFPWDVSLYATFARPPVTADLDNNGKMELLAAHTNWNIYKGNIVAYLWEIPASGQASKEWPLPLHDAQRSGNLGPSTDSDGDGFADSIETYIGTNPLKACPATSTPNDEPVDPWPPDFNDDGVVQIDDVTFVVGKFGLSSGDPGYTPRAELVSQDGIIQIDDVSRISGLFGRSCSP